MMGNGDVQLWDVPMGKPWGWIVGGATAMGGCVYALLAWRARRRIPVIARTS
jgi:hypothetical protein